MKTSSLALFALLSATSSTRLVAGKVAATPTASPMPTTASTYEATPKAKSAATPKSLALFPPSSLFDTVKSGTISFDDAYARHKAQNPEGLVFTVSLGEKSQFHSGERIPIELRFSSTKLGALKTETRDYDRSGRLNSVDDFVIASADGVVDPLMLANFWGIMGGLSRVPPVLGLKPEVVNLLLTDYRRFDKPGKYRLFVATNRVFSADKNYASMFGTPTATSEIVEFEILPFDAAWSAQKLGDIVARLNAPNRNARFGPGASAMAELRVLDTPEALREIVQRFGASDSPHWGDLHFGLLGTRHRNLAIEEIERQIDAPNGAVSNWLMRDLATLQIAKTKLPTLLPYDIKAKTQSIEYSMSVKKRDDAIRQINAANWQRLNRATQKKSGAARALSLQALLELLPPDAKMPTTTARAVLASWFDLPRAQQTRLLQVNWSALRLPEMTAVLKNTIANQPTGARDDGYDIKENFGQMLTRLLQISPIEGRRAILREIEYSKPRAKIEILSSLPDATLPLLDDVFLNNLQNSRDFADGTIHAQLIERYASPRIAPRVRAFFEKLPNGDWPTGGTEAFLAYLLRVDSPYAMTQIEQRLENAKNDNAYELLPSIARLYSNDEFEKLLVAQLNSTNYLLVRDAANALSVAGSSATEAVLWKRLHLFHNGLKGEQPNQQQKVIEESLWKALSSMPSVLTQRAKAEQLRDLITDKWQRQQVEGLIRYSELGAIPLGFRALSYDSIYTLGQYGRFGFKSFESLTRKLSQFPRGTIFKFEDDYSSSFADSDAVRKLLSQWLQTRGMTLQARDKALIT